ncbi:type 1 fimbrial protein, partial [Salmonella enterica subsp. enterica serovar Javiana]|nr:type 1 fimbrial protein [Salmonella enterica subsp. enterica serovar Javiana]
MCTLCSRILSVSLYVFSLFTPPSGALQISPRWSVDFFGSIVEVSCDVSSRQQHFEFTCMRDGKMRKNRYNQQQVTTASLNVQQIATVNLHYLNEQKNMAILN